jgi:hypothetical protein
MYGATPLYLLPIAIIAAQGVRHDAIVAIHQRE